MHVPRIAVVLLGLTGACNLYFTDPPSHRQGSGSSDPFAPEAGVYVHDAYIWPDAPVDGGGCCHVPDAGYGHDAGVDSGHGGGCDGGSGPYPDAFIIGP